MHVRSSAVLYLTSCLITARGGNFPPVWESAARAWQGSHASHPALQAYQERNATLFFAADEFITAEWCVWNCDLSLSPGLRAPRRRSVGCRGSTVTTTGSPDSNLGRKEKQLIPIHPGISCPFLYLHPPSWGQSGDPPSRWNGTWTRFTGVERNSIQVLQNQHVREHGQPGRLKALSSSLHYWVVNI